jgi:hypothetical protein
VVVVVTGGEDVVHVAKIDGYRSVGWDGNLGCSVGFWGIHIYSCKNFLPQV